MAIKETNRLDGDFFFHLTAGKSIASADDSIVATSQLGTATPSSVYLTSCIGGKAGAVSYSFAIECAGGCASYLAGLGTVATREDPVVAGSRLGGTTTPKSYAVTGIGGDASSMLDDLTAKATTAGTPRTAATSAVGAGEDPVVAGSRL